MTMTPTTIPPAPDGVEAPADPPAAADRLAEALAVLGSPRKAMHLDAATAAVIALAELRGEDCAAVAAELLRLAQAVQELRDTIGELTDRVDPRCDGR